MDNNGARHIDYRLEPVKTNSNWSHDETCTCEPCHAFHLEKELVEENAYLLIQCCENQILDWKMADEWCPFHGHSDKEKSCCYK